MRMSDIMSHVDLAVWPTIGLVLFLIVFACMAGRVLLSKRPHNERIASLPLDDDEPAHQGRLTNREDPDVA
ncbi:MAG: cbb3-type cytochrome c oxidase subunit 3 [Planctomycetota bacterium]